MIPCKPSYLPASSRAATTRKLVLAAVAAFGLSALPAHAEEVPMEKLEQAVKYRQNVMSTLGGLTGVTMGQMRDGFAYGPDLNAVAAALQAMSTDFVALFPEGTDFGETKAKAEIWSDSAGFADKSKQAADAANAFAEAVKSGDKAIIMQAFKGVGESCKGCHEAYRAE